MISEGHNCALCSQQMPGQYTIQPRNRGRHEHENITVNIPWHTHTMWEFVWKNNPIQIVMIVQEFECTTNMERSQQEDKKPWCSSLLSSSVSSLLFWSFPELLFWSFPELLFCLFLCCFPFCRESWGTFSSEWENRTFSYLVGCMHACVKFWGEGGGGGGWGEEDKGKGERERGEGGEKMMLQLIYVILISNKGCFILFTQNWAFITHKL